jgi:dipeptidyl aminopeptidase/acylaminoacyl peptidase
MGSRRVVFEDLLRFKVVSDLRLSPDGRRLAFVVSEPDAKEDTTHSNIWLVDADGTARQLTAGGRDGSPRWSPDQSRIAFLSVRGSDAQPQVYVLPVAGGEARPLSKGLKGAASLEWSPRGDRLAVIAWKATPESDMEDLLRALHWDGAMEEDRLKGRPHDPPERNPGELASEQQGESGLRISRRVKYRFDGVGYFDGRRRHLHLVAADVDEPAEAKAVTSGEYDVNAFDWHPDGERVAFLTNREADEDGGWRQDVWQVALADGALTKLAHGPSSLWSLGWSPDGTTLAVVGDDGRHGISTDSTLFVVAGGALVDVARDFDRPVGSGLFGDLTGFVPLRPIWSEDSASVLFLAVDHGTAGVYRARLHGSGQAAVELVTPKAWQGAVHEVDAAAGRIVGVVTTPAQPPEAAEIPAGGEPKAITSFNTAVAAELDLVPAQRLAFTGPDGWEIEGWLMRPPGAAIGPVPLILNIHGGPHGCHGLAFNLEWQAQAAAGRAVLFINPRGSNGYGQEFTRACVNDWGGKDFQDLMAGVDAAIAAGGIDTARLVVTGISYGGFMTSWTIGHTDRFAAAIPEMLVGNLVSFFGTSDIGTWFIPAEVAGDPFAGLEKAWHHSPLAHLDQANTPTLVIEGEADWRCPIEQGEQVYATLRQRGVEAALVRFPNASHIFSLIAPPSMRLRRQRVAAAWMDRHAKA